MTVPRIVSSDLLLTEERPTSFILGDEQGFKRNEERTDVESRKTPSSDAPSTDTDVSNTPGLRIVKFYRPNTTVMSNLSFTERVPVIVYTFWVSTLPVLFEALNLLSEFRVSFRE